MTVKHISNIQEVSIENRKSKVHNNSLKLKFGAMHFIYYINRSIATKVDSTYLGY